MAQIKADEITQLLREQIQNYDSEMHVDEVLSLDLSYAPPFSPVWDPVLIAARKAFDAVEADWFPR